MNQIHPSAVIGPGVEIGVGNIIGPGATLFGPLKIGDNNWIGPNVAIGTPGEVHGGAHTASWLEPLNSGGVQIGDNNIIREFVTVQQPHYRKTIIGSNCFIMTKAHIPHDGIVEDNVTISCSVIIGGHSYIQSGANLGLGSILHPYTVIGTKAMIGMGTVLTKNVPPLAMAYGVPGRIKGANFRRMQKENWTADQIDYWTKNVDKVSSGEFELPIEFQPLVLNWLQAIDSIQLSDDERMAAPK